MAELTVRPPPGTETRPDGQFCVYVTPAYFVRYKLKEGLAYNLRSKDAVVGSAILARAESTVKPDVIQVSLFLQACYRLKLGNRILLAHEPVVLPHAAVVSIREDEACSSGASVMQSEKEESILWLRLVQISCMRSGVIATGQRVAGLQVLDELRSYTISQIAPHNATRLYSITNDTKFQFSSSGDNEMTLSARQSKLSVPRNGIGGLNAQFDKIDAIVKSYEMAEYTLQCKDGIIPRERGILLHGPAGVGKSAVITQIAKAGWKSVFTLDTIALKGSVAGRATDAAKEMFSAAVQTQPSVIIIDNLDVLAPHDASEHGAFAQFLCSRIDGLAEARVLIVAATRSLANMSQELRHIDRCSTEIEIPVPDAIARAEILKHLTNCASDTDSPKLDLLARRTHGYTGRDLENLRRIAGRRARDRTSSETHREISSVAGPSTSGKLRMSFQIDEDDYDFALQKARPTAMREIFVETPQVRWTDIGGQEKVKELLQEAIIWPFKFPQEVARLNIQQSSGLLLYGPPGCSKTMTAKAVATESGLNFIAVKGAQLLNMYVGETERAIRELFSKARAARPSILFFDEIDAIAGSRDTNQHSGVQTVTTLLNEIDGIDEGKGVFVLAATNRPEILDPALTRPGRIDDMIYVGPPDTSARQHILEMHSKDSDLAEDIDFTAVADMTERCSGAEIAWLCQRASKLALREQLATKTTQKVQQRHFIEAARQVKRNITVEMEKAYIDFAMTKDR